MLAFSGINIGILAATSKDIGSISKDLELIKKEYVPGELLYMFGYTYDQQFKALNALDNGDRELAAEIMETFAKERKEIYDRAFRYRSN